MSKVVLKIEVDESEIAKLLTCFGVLPVVSKLKTVNQPASSGWEELTIKVIDKDTIVAPIDGKITHCNFTELGFKDKRTGLADEQWQALLDLARNDGTIRWGESGSRKGLKIIIFRLSQRLKAIFKIPGNPFYPYKEFKSYKARFTIQDISYGKSDL